MKQWNEIQWNTMNKNNEYYQIAKKLIFCVSYQSFNVKMILQITNVWYQQHRSVFTNFQVNDTIMDTQKECISFFECTLL